MAVLRCFKKIRSLCLLPFILHDDRGLLALFSPMIFLSGLYWPRWVLWVTQLCQRWFFIWSSSTTNTAWSPGSWQAYCHHAFRGGICCWFRPKILLGLGIRKCNFQENFCIWHVCLASLEKAVAVWAAHRGGLPEGDSRGWMPDITTMYK